MAIAVIALTFLLCFVESFNYEDNYGWICLIISISLIVLYFSFGFYWIFQKVEFDEKGIKIVILNRIIRCILWEEIKEIKYEIIMRNPAYVLTIINQKDIHLDSRKKIKSALEFYGTDFINEQIKKLNS